jgi:copper(I)-binding protein
VIKLASAYLMQPTWPGVIDGYVVIQNLGSADQLLAVRSSAGGTIVLRGLAGQGAATVRTVSALSIPGHSIVRLDPAGVHLVITRSAPMHQGTEITLTLVFARAGAVRVAALVTNPQTGGNTYFGP